MFDCYCR